MSQLQERMDACMHLYAMCSAFHGTKMMAKRPKMAKFWKRAEQSFDGKRVSVVSLMQEFSLDTIEKLIEQAYEALRESKYYARVPDETRLWLMSKPWYHGAWYQESLDIDKVSEKERVCIQKAREKSYNEDRTARRRTRE